MNPAPSAMENEPRENAPGPMPEEELEYKPVVKYIGIGLAVAALLGVEYATYHFGVRRGYAEAMASGNVTESVNAAAVENLTHFMQAATADDATLAAAVANRAGGLAWIKDETVRREAEWTLAQALMDRGKAHEGTELFAGLLQQAPATGIWARRALLAARAMAGEGYMDAALAYCHCAADRFEALQARHEQLEAMAEMVELLAAAGTGGEGAISALDALQGKAAALGGEGLELRANILAYMGRLHRVHGNRQAALKCFEEALAGLDLQKRPEQASVAVCLGSALLEKGDKARAAELLRDGVSRLGDGPADAPYVATALRDLSRLEMESGNTDNALALLYRSEGAAKGRIPEGSSFWVCLYDQRGWVNFARGAYKLALADFNKALEKTGEAGELRVQPLEGAGRCQLTLGQGETAVRHLQECCSLREHLFAEDAPALGRVCLLLGQAYDLAGEPEKAAEAYGRSAGLLPDGSPDRLSAMFGRAYALAQLGQWESATEAWVALAPLVQEDAALKNEADSQLAYCKRRTASDTGVKGEPPARETPRSTPRRR